MTKNLKILPAPQLGGGYSTDMQIPTINPCLVINNSSIVSGDGGKSTINLGNSKTFLQIQGELGIQVAGIFNIFLYASDTSAIYAREIEDDLYSQTFYFSESVTFPTQVFNPVGFGTNALNGFGQYNYNQSAAQFRANCGDQFIREMIWGASLFVAFQLDFLSLSDKETFTLYSGTSSFAGIIDTSSTIQTIINTYHLAGTINLIAYQSGGNPSALAQIFGNYVSGYYVTSCTFANLPACQQVIDGIVNYAVNDFSNQLNMTNGVIPASAAPIGASYFPYTILGLDIGSTVVTSDIIQARANLGNLYQDLNEQYTFMSHILSSSIAQYITPTVKSYIQATLTNITQNVAILEGNQDDNSGAILCYTQPTNCVNIAQNLLAVQAYVNGSFIDSFTTAYQISYDMFINPDPGPNECDWGPTGSSFNGIAIPIGENNFTKQQQSGFIETLEITSSNAIDDEFIHLHEPYMSSDCTGFDSFPSPLYGTGNEDMIYWWGSGNCYSPGWITPGVYVTAIDNPV